MSMSRNVMLGFGASVEHMMWRPTCLPVFRSQGTLNLAAPSRGLSPLLRLPPLPPSSLLGGPPASPRPQVLTSPWNLACRRAVYSCVHGCSLPNSERTILYRNLMCEMAVHFCGNHNSAPRLCWVPAVQGAMRGHGVRSMQHKWATCAAARLPPPSRGAEPPVCCGGAAGALPEAVDPSLRSCAGAAGAPHVPSNAPPSS